MPRHPSVETTNTQRQREDSWQEAARSLRHGDAKEALTNEVRICAVDPRNGGYPSTSSGDHGQVQCKTNLDLDPARTRTYFAIASRLKPRSSITVASRMYTMP